MKQRIKRSLVTLEATGAVLCFGGGILAGLVGSLLTASTWILGAETHPWMSGLGTALLIATIPLLIFAGYCLDWIERDMKKPLDLTPPNRDADADHSHPYRATKSATGNQDRSLRTLYEPLTPSLSVRS